jgi:uncharacterized protein (TIGR02145 family)
VKKSVLFLVLSGFFYSNLLSQTVTDYDGNIYTTVIIGNQQWLVENLKVTHFRNGDPVLLVANDSTWLNLTTAAYCWFDNDTNHKATYGALYNWFTTIDDRNIAPPGCHVPTKADWEELIEYLGGVERAGGKMKETGTIHWFTPNIGATNSSGFTGLPGGNRVLAGFRNMELVGSWWSCTYDSVGIAYARGLYYNDSIAYYADGPCAYGFSIRCLKDSVAGINDLNEQNDLIIYPDPSPEFIKVEYSDFQPGSKISIYDLTGKIMLDRFTNRNNIEINIESLPKGIYFLRITDNRRIVQRKFIKF